VSGDLSYYKISTLLSRWTEKKGARPVQASLSMDKPAPLPPGERPPKPPKPDPVVKMADDIGKAIDAFSRFKTWLNTPDTPKSPKSAEPSSEEVVPPFDIQEIPGAMRKENMPMGAKLMERWFAGRLNYSRTDEDEKAYIDQDGEPYAADMFEQKLITLNWTFKFERAKKKYDYLIETALRSDAAKLELYRKLFPLKRQFEIDTTNLAKNDPLSLHRLYQFQMVSVDGSMAEQIRNQLVAEATNWGVPDDLTAALGSFNYYAAIGHVRFNPDIKSGVRMSDEKYVEIKGVWVYVKDDFTFTDKPGDRSQYLGHWSSDGVIVLPTSGVAAKSPYIPYVESPVVIGQKTIKGDVYYPIHNSDFRAWQERHGRGGDFVIFSDRRYVPLNPPIMMYL